MLRSRFVVFDFDRTLVRIDFDASRLEADVRALFRGSGIDRPVRPFLRTIEEVTAEVARVDPARGEELNRNAWDLIDRAEFRGIEGTRLLPGARELLDRLAGTPLVLYSNNRKEVVLEILDRLGIPRKTFAAIRAREGAGTLKPSGRPILEAWRELGRPDVDLVFMVGDHPFDAQSALEAARLLREEGARARVVPVGIYSDAARAEELDRAGAWFLAADLREAGRFLTTPAGTRSLSVVLLAFNEEAAIERAVTGARRFLELYVPDHEVIVVDDGSTDATPEILRGLAGPTIRILTHATNRGMGDSMRDGYEAARKEFICHLPGDRQVRPEALLALLPHVSPDAVVKSRYANPPSGSRRALLSITFRWLTRWVAGLRVDFAGTYVFHQGRLSGLDRAATASRSFVYSFELLEQFRRAGARFREVTIRTFPRAGGASAELDLRRIAFVFGELLASRRRRG